MSFFDSLGFLIVKVSVSSHFYIFFLCFGLLLLFSFLLLLFITVFTTFHGI